MSKATAAPKPDLTAELAKDTVATTPVETVTPAPEAKGLSAEDEAQLALEKATVERMEAEETAARVRANIATGSTFADAETEAERDVRQFQERKAKFGTQYVMATGGRGITDPDTGKSFGPDKATRTVLTGWVEYQLANGKLTIEADD